MAADPNIIEKLGLLYKALHTGESLENASAWSNKANAGAALLVILQSVVVLAKSFGYDLHLEGADLQSLAEGIGAVGVGLVAVLHTASNPHAGKSK